MNILFPVHEIGQHYTMTHSLSEIERPIFLRETEKSRVRPRCEYDVSYIIIILCF